MSQTGKKSGAESNQSSMISRLSGTQLSPRGCAYFCTILLGRRPYAAATIDMIKRLAVLDDYQGAAFAQPYWKQLENRVEHEGYRDTLHDEDRLIERLRPYEILVAIRERTHFTARVLERLPQLELLSLDR